MKPLDLGLQAPYLRYTVHGLRHYRDVTGAVVLAFSGIYRWGGQGNPDARFMRGIARLVVECVEPANLILDLSRLRYEWGDEMADIAPHDWIPVALVPGPRCAAALAPLFFGVHTDRLAIERTGVFASVSAARRYLCAQPWQPRGYAIGVPPDQRVQARHLGLRGA